MLSRTKGEQGLAEDKVREVWIDYNGHMKIYKEMERLAEKFTPKGNPKEAGRVIGIRSKKF